MNRGSYLVKSTGSTCGNLLMKSVDCFQNANHDLGCITWSGRGTLCKINGNMNAEKYISILDEQLLPVIVRHFPDNSYIFQVTRHKYHRNLLASGEEKFAKTGRRNFYQISCSMLFLTFGRMSQLITLKSCIIPYHGEFLFAFDQRDTSQGTKGM